MKKKLVALLISITMVSASMVVPVYAEDETIPVEVTDEDELDVEVEDPEEQQQGDEISVDEKFSDETTEEFSDQDEEEILSAGSESADTKTTAGGNINWGSSNSILPADVTTAGNDCTFLGIRGSYITDMQNALNRINEIRKEACDEGIKDPRNESRNLTSSDYVPIKWSSDLEYIARIRAAEASVYRQHVRLNGSKCWAISSPNGIKSYGEVLAWNTAEEFLPGLEQWYKEKADWVGNTGKTTGHYTQMIDPDNDYVGLATFINANAQYSTTTAGEFTSQQNADYNLGTSHAVLDESAGPAIDNCIQTVEVKDAMIVAGMTDLTEPLAAKNSIQAEFTLTGYDWKMESLSEVSWISSDTKTATVDSTGNITGIHEGTADITASCGSLSVTKTVQVTGHPNIELKNAKEATCKEEGYTGDQICKDCRATIEAGKTIPKKEHNWDAGKITTQVTCTEPGVKTYTCKDCGTTKTETIPATGHKAVTDPAVAVTCETNGKTEGSHCSVCNKVLIEQKTIKATGHNWDEGKITKEATCENAGEKIYTCKTCKKTKAEEIKALGHKEVTDPAVAVTCETNGKTEGSHCSVCNKVLIEQKTIKATGHKAVTDPAVAVTCETDGKTEGSHCSVCGKVFAKQEVIQATGHKFSAWKTTRQADVLSPEVQTRMCSVCGKNEQKTVGNKLKGTMTVNLSSIPLKTKQRTNVLKVSGLAKGDSVVSWKSGNSKIVNVKGNANGTSTLTAGKKTGKTKIIITLKSGLQKAVTVSVQKSTVRTKKITGIAKSLRLNRRQKIVLSPRLTPLTSTEKITYKSNNSKVASVNRKGQLVAKKKGTAVITVKSGSKTVKCRVSVR